MVVAYCACCLGNQGFFLTLSFFFAKKYFFPDAIVEKIRRVKRPLAARAKLSLATTNCSCELLFLPSLQRTEGTIKRESRGVQYRTVARSLILLRRKIPPIPLAVIATHPTTPNKGEDGAPFWPRLFHRLVWPSFFASGVAGGNFNFSREGISFGQVCLKIIFTQFR